MRKIKSVKLKKDYSTPHHFYEKGTNLKIDVPKNNLVCLSGSYYSPEAYPDFFKIEYEEERKYIDVRIEYNYDSKMPFQSVELALKEWFTAVKDIKVTELHGNNFIDFGHYVLDHPGYLVENAYKNWCSERSNK